MLDDQRKPRKLIVFTEHRDTLNYLVRRMRTLLGRPRRGQSPSTAASAGMSADGSPQEFTSNPDVQILVATDAAGEGSTSRQRT